MKGFAKGLALCLLLLSLLATTVSAAPFDNCGGNCSHQAAINTTHYDTLQEAVDAANAGATVTLLSDLTIDALEINKSLTLNLGGKTLTGTPADGQALLTFTDGGVIRGGKLCTSSGSILKIDGCTVTIEKDALLEGSGTAPVVLITAAKDHTAQTNISGEITAKTIEEDDKIPAALIQVISGEGSCEVNILKNAKITAQKNLILDMDSAGKLSISGGTLRSLKDMFHVQVAENRKLEISITDGQLLSTEGNVFTFTKHDDTAVIPGNFVTGGTYYKVPAYVPAYCLTRDNQDTTYTVISGYTMTFQSGNGSGAMNPAYVRCDSSYTLPECGFTAPQGKDFLTWEIDGTLYAPGSIYTPSGNATIKALWGDHVHRGGNATCQKKAVCSSCGESYGMIGSHNTYSVSACEPTCTTDGMNAHRRCATCGKRFVNGEAVSVSALSMPALGHFWQQEAGMAADCQHDGILAHARCVNCDLLQAEGITVTEDALVIPAGNHALESIPKSDATCTQAGTLAHDHCTVCDLLLIDNKPVDAAQLTTGTISHVLSDWESDAHEHWKACVDCGEEFRRGSHKFGADGTCSDCGYTVTAPENAAADPNGFSWMFLIPIVAAVGIAGALVLSMLLKKRK